MPDTYEFQFRFRAGRRASFGFDVNAHSIEEAVAKANQVAASEDMLIYPSAPTERAWINLPQRITRRCISSIYGPLGSPDARDHDPVSFKP